MTLEFSKAVKQIARLQSKINKINEDLVKHSGIVFGQVYPGTSSIPTYYITEIHEATPWFLLELEKSHRKMKTAFAVVLIIETVYSSEWPTVYNDGKEWVSIAEKFNNPWEVIRHLQAWV